MISLRLPEAEIRTPTPFTIEPRARPSLAREQLSVTSESLGSSIAVTERKRAEQERAAHLWFLESMDRINRAIQGTQDLEKMMSDVLDAVLEIFACDRAWLVYPCDPAAVTWRAVMEHTQPQFPGAFALAKDLPLDAEVATVFATARATGGAVPFGPACESPVPAQLAARFGIRSLVAAALYPKGDQPYLLGLHQCSHPREWTAQEMRLFEEIGRRLTDSLTSLLMWRRLLAHEAKLDEAQRIAHVGHWEYDIDMERAALSNEASRIHGLERRDVPLWLQRLRDLVHPDDRAKVMQAFAAAVESGIDFEVECRLRLPSGETRIVHKRARAIRDESGRAVRLFGIVEDVTELRRTEQELRSSEARFRVLVDFAADAFFLFDEDGTVLDVNAQACESLGYRRDELVGTKLAGSRHPDVDKLVAIFDRCETGRLVTCEARLRRKDGGVYPIEVRARRFDYNARTLTLCLARDITERKHADADRANLKERLRQAERMEAIGRFASGIAHDFNNVLGGIVGYGEMLVDEAPENTKRKRHAQNVLAAAHRGQELVEQILAFTRGEYCKRRPTDVGRTALEAIELVRSSLPACVNLHVAIPDVPMVVMGDATQLHQIVMNLCSNSIHAMSAGGILRVALSRLDVRADLGVSHGILTPGRYVHLRVEDNGCGIDDATLARIFEPFFTTKETGRGTGLGLALVHGIVAGLSGVIHVTSVLGAGTTFSVYIPMADANVATANP